MDLEIFAEVLQELLPVVVGNVVLLDPCSDIAFLEFKVESAELIIVLSELILGDLVETLC